MLGLTISYMYTRNCTAANPEGRGKPIITKRDNTGKVKTPDMKLISPGVPVSSSDNAGYLHWMKVFAKFLHTNCMAAWHIWMTEEDNAQSHRHVKNSLYTWMNKAIEIDLRNILGNSSKLVNLSGLCYIKMKPQLI